MTSSCCIKPVGKRRDGKMRFWCMTHRATAVAKGGVRLERCLEADRPEVPDADTLVLRPEDYPGGIALWGATPAAYSTASHDLPELGVHVHARCESDGGKQIDHTFRRVCLAIGGGLVEVGVEDAVYFMVSSVLGQEMVFVACTRCGHPHLDKDWFSVHQHRKHLCAGCGRNFSDRVPGIGNPLLALKARFNDPETHRRTVPAGRRLNISQRQFANGIELWGSNEAIVWTAARPEEQGIHVHAFADDPTLPAVDDTFDEVIVDGVAVDPEALRILMAQQALPHLAGRIVSLDCPDCGTPAFDRGDLAFTPRVRRRCGGCHAEFASPHRLKKVISNPMVAVLETLESSSPRPGKPSVAQFRPEI